jgi:Mycobacterium 19 kDa lipoprotein antigen
MTFVNRVSASLPRVIARATLLSLVLAGCSANHGTSSNRLGPTSAPSTTSQPPAWNPVTKLPGTPGHGPTTVTVDGQTQTLNDPVRCFTASDGTYNVLVTRNPSLPQAIGVVFASPDSTDVKRVNITLPPAGSVAVMYMADDASFTGDAAATKAGSTYKISGHGMQGVGIAPKQRSFDVEVTCP